MRRRTGICTGFLLASFAAGCGSTTTVVQTTTVKLAVRPALSATGDQRIYGHIESLRRTGGHYELRFDPSLLVSGVTANTAHAEDDGTVCQPSACPAVANDNYVIDEGHRLLVFIVPVNVRGSVLAKGGSNGVLWKTITARQLAQLVANRSSVKLVEPLSSGVWILVHSDTVRRFAQQYHP